MKRFAVLGIILALLLVSATAIAGGDDDFFGYGLGSSGGPVTDLMFNPGRDNPLFLSGSLVSGQTASFADPGGEHWKFDPVTYTLVDSGGELRVQRVDGILAALLEPEAANILLGNRGVDIASWDPSNASAAADATGVDGQANYAATLTDAAAGAAGYIHDTISISPNSGPWTFTFFLAVNSTPTAYPGAGFYFSGGAGKIAQYCLNPTDGGATAASTNSAASVSISDPEREGNFWKYSITATDNGANDTLQYILYPAWAESESGTKDNAAQGSNIFDFAQLEYAAFPSSLISTEGQSLATMSDISGWEAEVDGANRLVTSGTSLLTITGLDGDEDCYRLDDRSGSPEDTTAGWTHQFQFKITTGADGGMALWAVADANDDLVDIDGASGDYIALWVFENGGSYYARTEECNGGTVTTGTSVTLSANTMYYVKVVENPATGSYGAVQAAIYSDSLKDTLVGTSIIALTKDATFDYAGIASKNDGTAGVAFSAIAANYTWTSGNPQIVVDPGFDVVALGAAVGVAGITKANPGVLTLDPGHGKVDGDVLFFSGLTEMTELNGEYWRLCNNAGDTFELSTAEDDSTSLDTSGYGAAETTGGNCAQEADPEHWSPGTWHLETGYDGTLTGKMLKTAGTASNLSQTVNGALNKSYRYGVTITNYSAGTLYQRIGSSNPNYADGNGTWWDYHVPTVGSATTFYNYAASNFAGTVDNIEVVEHGTARASEAGALYLGSDSPSFDSTFTLVAKIRPHFDEDEVSTDGAFVSCKDAIQSLIYHDTSGNGFAVNDGTTEITKAISFVKDTPYFVVVTAETGGNFNIGAIADSTEWSSAAWATGQGWDGDFNMAGNGLQFLYGAQGGADIGPVLIYERALSDNQIKALQRKMN